MKRFGLVALLVSVFAVAGNVGGIGGQISRSDLFRKFFTWDSSNNVTSAAGVTATGQLTANGSFVSQGGSAFSGGAMNVGGSNSVLFSGASSQIAWQSTSPGAGISVGVTAGNAGNTPSTTGFSIYPTNALDNSDYVFNIGNVNNGSSLFNVTYDGTVSASNFSGTTTINFIIFDGGTLRLADTTTFPPFNSGDVLTAWNAGPASNLPAIVQSVSTQWGLPVPLGLIGTNAFNNGQDGQGTWFFSGSRAVAQSNGAHFDYNNGTLSVIEGSGGVVAWANTSFRTRNLWVNMATSTGTTNGLYGGIRENEPKCWVGNAPGIGGALYYTRFYVDVVNAKQALFIGLLGSSAAFSIAGESPSQLADSFYVGCDTAGATLNVCSNDNVGLATCVDLGSNFPAQTQFAMYDVWLFIPPNPGLLWYDVERYDVRASATGALDGGDNPRVSVQLSWHDIVGIQDGGVQNTAPSFKWNSSLLWCNL